MSASKKSLNAVGSLDAVELMSWHLPPRKRSELLEVIDREADDPEAVTFLESIEHAIRSALWRQDLQPRRAEVKTALLRAAEQSKALLDALGQIPDAGRQYFFAEGMPWTKARENAAKVWRVADSARLRAEDDLSGAGDDHDNNPAILAADIAKALKQAGIKPSLTRPKYNKHGEISRPPFWTVTVICFQQALFPHKDPLRHMKDGRRRISIVGCAD
ncbi:hypothetical protein [Geobacter pickeringii]|uniref:Uncharacterized protein n=1 Tax=Geobacter pickeringii TaxID=345632 RepID=A0A0B5BHL2_9BACT|nr:hypothetical protein [Geobacter pickeringii]AJE04669.1 hypothetical protein GPICK_15990 [Geobacter pickeringii]